MNWRPYQLTVAAVSVFGPVSPAVGQSALPLTGFVEPGSPAVPDQLEQTRQEVGDAWWTGPVIASSPETLPPRHMQIEPYFYDMTAHGSATPGSLSNLYYGIAPRFSAGVLPSVTVAKGIDGRRILRMGDISLGFKYRLTKSNPEKTTPTLAFALRERLPTAPFDELKNVEATGGSGNFGTMIGFYGQQYFWLPNGRILRGRFNLTHTFESKVRVRDISVYGTPEEFRGVARPGSSTTADLAAEYSITSQFVVAMDLLHAWIDRTVVVPRRGSGIVSSAQRYFAVVPAFEYNWSSRSGLILGSRWILRGRGKAASWTPIAAYNHFL